MEKPLLKHIDPLQSSMVYVVGLAASLALPVLAGMALVWPSDEVMGRYAQPLEAQAVAKTAGHPVDATVVVAQGQAERGALQLSGGRWER
jgi:hypothetical protein